MTKTESATFRAAKAVSCLSDHKQKVGCVVVNKHRIISSGANSDTKTHPLQKQYNRYRFNEDTPHKCHAELLALLPLIRDGVDLSGASIFIYREHKDYSMACARPCKSCMKLIRDCNIKRAYYTTEDGYVKEDLKL